MKIFLDSSDLKEIEEFKDKVDGFTTNPSLMRKAGVTNYEGFCKEVLQIIGNKPVSFEVFADDFVEMERQARKIASWGNNIYVKIPVINTKGELSEELLHKLLDSRIKVNLTAITNKLYFDSLTTTPLIISIFAGRIADTGIDPTRFFSKIILPVRSKIELLWASTREVLNIYQAEQAGADIITCTADIIRKYEKFKGMDLNELSLLTVQQFYADAKASGYTL